MMTKFGLILASILAASFIGEPFAYSGGVTNGQPVNASVTNAAYLFKNANDSSIYKYLFGASGTASSQLQVTGNADIVQLLIKGNATQTSKVLVCQKSDSTELFSVNNSGNGVLLGSMTAAGVNVSGQTASTVPYLDSSKNLVSSSVTPTELGYVSGVTSSIQTQLNGKQASGNYITALTGDVAASGPGSVSATIQSGAVSNSKLASMVNNTIKGNVSGSSAAPSDLTATQATAMLNAMVGDSGSGGTKGLVPAPGAGDAAAGKFLRADGVFAVPSGTTLVAPTFTSYTSGSGTYTTPVGVLYLHIKMSGGGGGGAGSGTSAGTVATDGADTTFGLHTAAKGLHGIWNNGLGGAGGTGTIGAGAYGRVYIGGRGRGGGGSTSLAGVLMPGGSGGINFFGGSAGGGGAGTDGNSGLSNTGAGGAGGGTNSSSAAANISGDGGGAGGVLDIIIPTPSSTYSFSVGAGGNGGGAGPLGQAGGPGGTGAIDIWEYRQ